MNIFASGQPALVEDIHNICNEAGYIHNPDLPVDAVFDFHLADLPAKRQFLESVAADLIFTAAVPCSATEAASWSVNPSRVIGISPVIGKTIEFAPALQTAPDVLAHGESLLRELGLQIVPVADGPGLVRLRILSCIINEAIATAADGVASIQDIDAAMKLGANYPLGPLEWADTLTPEVVLAVMRALQYEYGEDRYRPTPLLVRKVQAKQNLLAP
ncbi:MAG: 3-hydroxybutyryl-CoA dehydrogenase [Chloroflexi bacterium]|nr:3-hydroxybutyryl-CoA dehydrogenase [Chloroflexota bacterium]